MIKNTNNGVTMRKLGLIFLSISISLSMGLAQEKLAQTGAQFLSVNSDARGGGLAGALTTVEMNSAALFFNPASMARMSATLDVMASQNEWFADIMYNAFSISFSPSGGKFGVFGASLVSVDYGEIQGTVVAANNQGYYDTEILTPSSFAFGLGYAKALSDKFSVGGHVKYVGLNYGKSIYPDEDGQADTVISNLAFANAFDFGTIFRTGWKSLAFGMSVRNFSNEITFEEEGFQLPLTFTLGISMDIFDLKRDLLGDQKMLMSIDALHYRSHPEQIRIGLEYKPVAMLAFRTGYMSNNDENAFSYGVGLEQFGLVFDYAYEPYGRLGDVQRITARFSF